MTDEKQEEGRLGKRFEKDLIGIGPRDIEELERKSKPKSGVRIVNVDGNGKKIRKRRKNERTHTLFRWS